MAPDAGCIESNPNQQGWYVPHDVDALAALVGGKQAFVDRLNAVFEATPPSQMMRWNNYYNHSNEPVHQMAFMFALAGAPALTQKWSRYICEYAYSTGPGGPAGNDDCGQMSAWYVLASAGLYPVAPASCTYVVGSPVFDRIDFATATGQTFTVRAAGNSPANVYVRSARLNGKPLNRAWITYDEVMAGGTVTLSMSATPA
jgi:predicted alpha-1,2-mannosidase